MANKLETEIIMAESVLGKKLFPPETRSRLLKMAEAIKDDPNAISDLRNHFGERIDLVMETIRFLENMRNSMDLIAVARNVGQLDRLRQTAQSLDFNAPVFYAPDTFTSLEELALELQITGKTIMKIPGIRPSRFGSRKNPRQLSLFLSPEDVGKIRQTINVPPPGWKSVYRMCGEMVRRQDRKIGYKAILDALDVLADLIPERIGRFTKKNNPYCDAKLAGEIMACANKKDLAKLIDKYR